MRGYFGRLLGARPLYTYYSSKPDRKQAGAAAQPARPVETHYIIIVYSDAARPTDAGAEGLRDGRHCLRHTREEVQCDLGRDDVKRGMKRLK